MSIGIAKRNRLVEQLENARARLDRALAYSQREKTKKAALAFLQAHEDLEDVIEEVREFINTVRRRKLH